MINALVLSILGLEHFWIKKIDFYTRHPVSVIRDSISFFLLAAEPNTQSGNSMNSEIKINMDRAT